MNLGIDLDGVVFDFSKAYAELLIKTTGIDKLPSDWRTNPESFTPTWYWERLYGYTKDEERATWDIILSTNFWRKLDLCVGVGTALKVLNRRAKQGDNVYFVTHRMGKKAKLQTEEALYEAGIDYPTVLLVKAEDKPTIINALDIGFFVDDKLETLSELVQYMWRNRKDMKGKHFLLKDAPYNRENRIKGLRVTPDLETALKEAGLWI